MNTSEDRDGTKVRQAFCPSCDQTNKVLASNSSKTQESGSSIHIDETVANGVVSDFSKFFKTMVLNLVFIISMYKYFY